MKKAATLLANTPSMKQAQLKIASFGTVAVGERSAVRDRLRHLKRKDHSPVSLGLGMSWSYFAGFFDAEGCIVVPPCRESIDLTVRQANPHVLEALLKFLHANNLFRWVLYSSSRYSSLQCADTACSKATLALLLDHGLCVKSEQAQLALAWTPGNHLEDAGSHFSTGWVARAVPTFGCQWSASIKRIAETAGETRADQVCRNKGDPSGRDRSTERGACYWQVGSGVPNNTSRFSQFVM